MATVIERKPSRLAMILVAILLPPAAVAAEQGITGQFWLNIVLTLLGFWILGMIHALFVVL